MHIRHQVEQSFKKKQNCAAEKVAFISPVIPPYPAGVSIIVERLIKAWPKNRYCLVGTEPISAAEIAQNKLEYPCFYLETTSRTYQQKKSIIFKFFKKIGRIVFAPVRFYKLCTRLSQIICKEGVTQLVYCTGDLLALPVCYHLSKKYQIPLIFYVFDDYINQWPYPILRNAIKLIEKRCIQQVTQIITTNELLSLAYFERYKVLPKIIHNGIDEGTSVIKGKGLLIDNTSNKPIKLVYTGSIYYAHYDVFLALVKFLNTTQRKVELHIYTSQEQYVLKNKGLISDLIFFHDYVAQDKVSQVLQNADLLFLPLSFNKKYQKIVETAAPCKMAEYLASGTPLLSIVPEFSFVSWYLKNHQCGIVISDCSSLAIEKKFQYLETHQEEIKQYCSNAFMRMQVDFSFNAMQAKLFKTLASGAD